MRVENGIPAFGDIQPGITYQERPGAYAFILNTNGCLAIVRTPNGLFLPGGGVDPNEDILTGLKRELIEEIGYKVLKAKLVGKAIQYHWSGHYQTHFKKVGSFFKVEAQVPKQETLEQDHELLWQLPLQAASDLTQEFQRYAVREYLIDS